MTGLEWVRAALVTLGTLDPIETPNDQEAADALDIGNDWIDALALDGFTLYYLLRTVVNLVASQASYTIGVGGDINIARPVVIEHAGLVLNTGTTPVAEIPLAVLTDPQWEGIVQKTYSSTYPTGLHYDYNWTAGLAQISLYPIPNQALSQLVLYTPSALTEMTLTGNVTFPPGYRRLLKLGLARELSAQGFDGWNGEKERLYLNAKAAVDARNLRPTDLYVGGRGRSNIYTGTV